MSKAEQLLEDSLSNEVISQLMATNEMMEDIFETIFKDLHPSIFFSIIPALIDMYCDDRNIDYDTKMEFMLGILDGMHTINNIMNNM